MAFSASFGFGRNEKKPFGRALCLAVLGLVYIERTAGEQQLFKKESPGRDWGRPLTQVNTG